MLTGCGGSTESADDGWSIDAALDQLPRGDDGDLTVRTGDVSRATELAGASRPAGDDTDDIHRWLSPLFRRTSIAPGSDVMRDPVFGMQTTLGVDLRDVDWYASVETPPRTFHALRLLDGATVKDDLVEAGDGLAQTATGTVGDPLERDAFPFIAAVRQEEDWVAIAQRSRDATAWRTGPTLAERTELTTLAAALKGLDGYSAVLATGELRRTRSDGPSDTTVRPVGDGLAFDAVGIMEGGTPDEPEEWIAYAVDDPEAARPTIEDRWRRGVSTVTGKRIEADVRVTSVDTADGAVVVKVRPVRGGVSHQMLGNLDTPFAPGG